MTTKNNEDGVTAEQANYGSIVWSICFFQCAFFTWLKIFFQKQNKTKQKQKQWMIMFSQYLNIWKHLTDFFFNLHSAFIIIIHLLHLKFRLLEVHYQIINLISECIMYWTTIECSVLIICFVLFLFFNFCSYTYIE